MFNFILVFSYLQVKKKVAGNQLYTISNVDKLTSLKFSDLFTFSDVSKIKSFFQKDLKIRNINNYLNRKRYL